MIPVDNNLSPRLVAHLNKHFPHSKHVQDLNMDEDTEDSEIWAFAKANKLVILTKDTDFESLSRLYGCPPKVIQLTCGNKTTAEIADIINRGSGIIGSFLKNKRDCLLYLE